MKELDLTATDGLTNSYIRFSRLDVLEAGTARLWFEITDEDRRVVGEIPIVVGRVPGGTTDAIIASGHAQMVNMLRQWLHIANVHYKAYAARPVID